jgi:hypothetical protein
LFAGVGVLASRIESGVMRQLDTSLNNDAFTTLTPSFDHSAFVVDTCFGHLGTCHLSPCHTNLTTRV